MVSFWMERTRITQIAGAWATNFNSWSTDNKWLSFLDDHPKRVRSGVVFTGCCTSAKEQRPVFFKNVLDLTRRFRERSFRLGVINGFYYGPDIMRFVNDSANNARIVGVPDDVVAFEVITPPASSAASEYPFCPDTAAVFFLCFARRAWPCGRRVRCLRCRRGRRHG